MGNSHSLKKNRASVSMTVIAAFFTVATILVAILCFSVELKNMSANNAFRCGFFIVEALILDLSMISTVAAKHSGDKSIKFFFAIQVLGAVDLLCDILAYFSNISYTVFICLLVLILLVSPVSCLLFWFFQQQISDENNKKKNIRNICIVLLCVLDCVFILISTAYGKMFTLDADMTYHTGSWNAFTYIYPLFVLVYCIIYNIRCKMDKRKHITCIIYAVTPIVFGLLALITKNTLFSHSAIVVGVLIIFAGIQNKKNERILLKKKQLDETMLNAAILQINPHFIQNCLTSIRDLMYIDVKEADEMIIDLSGYLRRTYSSLNHNGMIPVRQEMELVNFYLNIEKIRFPDMIQVEQQIDLPDFMIPPFIIEPLVENAVRHGLREKGAAGCIKILIRDLGTSVEICVMDDGAGFDVNKPLPDKENHIGLQNVRTRIELMTKGMFFIESKPGHGTKAVIFLPKEEEKQ